MRVIVLCFAVVAGLKVWTQDRFYRAAMSDVLVQTYRERAQQSCQKELAKPAKSPVATWTPDQHAEIVIGNPHAVVALWDFDNPLWEVRFRHPQLILTSGSPKKVNCAYDLVAGLASVGPR